VTANSIGINSIITVSANASGGVIGKMISPSSIAVAAAAGNLIGKESALFRFTLKHSFILLFFVCLMVLGQSYWFSSIVPKSPELSKKIISDQPVDSHGWILLLVFSFIIVGLVITINLLNKRKLTNDR
jgi:lactate permease